MGSSTSRVRAPTSISARRQHFSPLPQLLVPQTTSPGMLTRSPRPGPSPPARTRSRTQRKQLTAATDLAFVRTGFVRVTELVVGHVRRTAVLACDARIGEGGHVDIAAQDLAAWQQSSSPSHSAPTCRLHIAPVEPPALASKGIGSVGPKMLGPCWRPCPHPSRPRRVPPNPRHRPHRQRSPTPRTAPSEGLRIVTCSCLSLS